ETTGLIGRRWKLGNEWSRPVLIGRGLAPHRAVGVHVVACAVLGIREGPRPYPTSGRDRGAAFRCSPTRYRLRGRASHGELGLAEQDGVTGPQRGHEPLELVAGQGVGQRAQHRAGVPLRGLGRCVEGARDPAEELVGPERLRWTDPARHGVPQVGRQLCGHVRGLVGAEPLGEDREDGPDDLLCFPPVEVVAAVAHGGQELACLHHLLLSAATAVGAAAYHAPARPRSPRRSASRRRGRGPRASRSPAAARPRQKSMPSPPAPAPAPAPAFSFSGLSATTASVVRNSPAIDAAFCSAERVTLAGSMMPASIRSLYSPVEASRPWPCGRVLTFSTTTPP